MLVEEMKWTNEKNCLQNQYEPINRSILSDYLLSKQLTKVRMRTVVQILTSHSQRCEFQYKGVEISAQFVSAF